MFSGLTDQTRISPQSSSRNGSTIDSFLIHHQAGTNDDAVITSMVTGSREVSANYTISNEGRLTGVVPEELRAWTSGSSQDGGRGAAWDRRSITVEIENQNGSPNWPISLAAFSTAAKLAQDLKSRRGISNILGHRDLWERYRASYATFCPGPETVGQIATLAGGGTIVLPPITSGSSVDGTNYGAGAGRSAWTGLQLWLAREWGYTGLADGIPGRLTWTALQKFLTRYWGYAGLIDGIPGLLSWAATQRWLSQRFGYSGVIDGVPGAFTYAALGRAGADKQTVPPLGLPRTAIDGRPGTITWSRGQTWLARDWGYTGVIDGIPGRLTYSALQRFLARHWNYKGLIDGIPGRLTYGSMQLWLRSDWGYTGLIDGDPGVLTWSAFQRFVNSI